MLNIEEMKKRTDDKTTWDDGEWKAEPDILEGTDDETGLMQMIKRGPSGALCGYVAVGKDHPAFKLSYYKSDFDVDDVLSGDAVKTAVVQKQINDIEVHGGLTFAGFWEDKGDDVYWFGFDCAHAGDFSPKYSSVSELGVPTMCGSVIEYRNIEYVKEQCRQLAKQLSEIKTH